MIFFHAVVSDGSFCMSVLLIMRVACSSFNKKSNHAQGGQPRVNPSPVNSTELISASAARTIHNGSHVQPQLHGKL